MINQEAKNLVIASLNAPYVSVYTCGSGDTSLMFIKFSLDLRENWPNNIYENSRCACFCLDNSGSLEKRPYHHSFSVKFRKTKVKDINQMINKINSFIESVSK